MPFFAASSLSHLNKPRAGAVPANAFPKSTRTSPFSAGLPTLHPKPNAVLPHPQALKHVDLKPQGKPDPKPYHISGVTLKPKTNPNTLKLPVVGVVLSSHEGEEGAPPVNVFSMSSSSIGKNEKSAASNDTNSNTRGALKYATAEKDAEKMYNHIEERHHRETSKRKAGSSLDPTGTTQNWNMKKIAVAAVVGYGLYRIAKG